MTNPIRALSLFFVFEMLLVTLCLIIYGWPVQLQGLNDMITSSGTTPNDFALVIFVFGTFIIFTLTAFIYAGD